MSIAGRYITMRGGNIIGTPPNNIPTPYTYLVDAYSPIVAYSFWKLNSTSTVCLRVRRSNDNAEQDIGFDGNYLDVASMLSFVGANDGFIVKWRNQGTGGGTFPAVQNTASSQFRIVSAGVADLGAVNLSNDSMITTNGILHTLELSSFFVFTRPSTGVNTIGLASTTVNRHPFVWNTSNGIQSALGTLAAHATGQTQTGNFLATTIRNLSSDVNMWLNQAALTTQSVPFVSQTSTQIGRNGVTFNGANTVLKEILFFQTDQTANRLAIEANINSRHNVY